jgi:hypothetical protein
MNIEDQISVCAAGESAWHAAAYAGIGAEWREEPGWPGAPVVLRIVSFSQL